MALVGAGERLGLSGFIQLVENSSLGDLDQIAEGAIVMWKRFSLVGLSSTTLFLCGLAIIALAGLSACSQTALTLDRVDDDIVLSNKNMQRFEFVWIPEIDAWFAKYETPLWFYAWFAPYRVHQLTQSRDDNPEFSRSWPWQNPDVYECDQFCRYLNRVLRDQLPEGYEFRIPTREEWQTVARCGVDRIYPWGDDWPPPRDSSGVFPNLLGEDKPKSKEEADRYRPFYDPIPGYFDGHYHYCAVEQTEVNEWGVHGMGGNIKEWAFDTKFIEYVAVGGDAESSKPEWSTIEYCHRFKDKHWPMLPLLADRKSSSWLGLRLVLGKKLEA
jgi:hypothetical protein